MHNNYGAVFAACQVYTVLRTNKGQITFFNKNLLGTNKEQILEKIFLSSKRLQIFYFDGLFLYKRQFWSKLIHFLYSECIVLLPYFVKTRGRRCNFSKESLIWFDFRFPYLKNKGLRCNSYQFNNLNRLFSSRYRKITLVTFLCSRA